MTFIASRPAPRKAISALLVDSEVMFSQAVRMALADGHGVHVEACAASLDEATAWIDRSSFDLVVLSVHEDNLVPCEGFVRDIKHRSPHLRVLLLASRTARIDGGDRPIRRRPRDGERDVEGISVCQSGDGLKALGCAFGQAYRAGGDVDARHGAPDIDEFRIGDGKGSAALYLYGY